LAKGKLIFTKIIHDSQEYGSDDEHMASRVFFSIVLGDQKERNLYADVKLTVGANFDRDPIEVSLPRGLEGTINYGVFRKHVEDYYREQIGSKGKAICIDGCAVVRIIDLVIEASKAVDIEINGNTADTGW
jgi:hypothetical protein